MSEFSPILIAIVIIFVVLVIAILLMAIVSQRGSFNGNPADSGNNDNCVNPPETPTGLTVNNPQGDIIVFDWNDMAGATGYTAYLGSTPGFAPNDALQTRAVTSSSTSFANLTLGATYYLKVLAKNNCGNSALSNEISYVLPYTFPPRFRIQLSAAPSMILCDRHTTVFSPTDETSASAFCQTADSYSFYQESDQTIRQSARPAYCLTRTNGPNRIRFNPCVVNASQRWTYDNNTKNVCDATNLTDCLITTSSGATQRTTAHGTPTTDTVSDWNIQPI